jgi:hypothetical protein
MLMQRVTPLVMLLGGCGAPCAVASKRLVDVMRVMTAKLATRLFASDVSSETSATASARARADVSPRIGLVDGVAGQLNASDTPATNSAHHHHQHNDSSDLPWPTKEDAGVEARDRAKLQPLALFNAV